MTGAVFPLKGRDLPYDGLVFPLKGLGLPYDWGAVFYPLTGVTLEWMPARGASCPSPGALFPTSGDLHSSEVGFGYPCFRSSFRFQVIPFPPLGFSPLT